MMRDRLADLHSKQNGKPTDEKDGSNSAQDPLITREDWNSVDGFLERCTTANRELGIIEGYLAQIKTIHQKILSQPGSDKEFGAELRALYGKFADESRRLRSVVQKLDTEANAEKPLSAPEENKNSVNNRIKKNQIRVISTRLFNVINKFNSEQGDYKQKHLQEIQRTLKIQGHVVAESDVNEAIEKGEIDCLTKGLMLAVADKKALFHDVQVRHSEILALETSIRELHELFTDMLHLVQSQGVMIDNIEQNVNTAVDYANKAKVNVIGAKTAQRRARKMKIFICIGLTVLAVILFFILQGLVCMYTPIC